MTTLNDDNMDASSASANLDYDKIVDDMYANMDDDSSDSNTATPIESDQDTNKNTNGVKIPKERFDEVNNARKDAEERLRQEESRRKEVEEALLELKKSKTKGSEDSTTNDTEKERIRRELREEYGVIGKEQLENILAEKLSNLEKERVQKSELEQYKKEIARLSSEIDGTDGRPAFNQKEVEEYAERTKIFNLEAAYEHLHRDKLREWDFKNFRRKTVTPDNGSSTNGNARDKIKLNPGKSILDQSDLWDEVDRQLGGL